MCFIFIFFKIEFPFLRLRCSLQRGGRPRRQSVGFEPLTSAHPDLHRVGVAAVALWFNNYLPQTKPLTIHSGHTLHSIHMFFFFLNTWLGVSLLASYIPTRNLYAYRRGIKQQRQKKICIKSAAIQDVAINSNERRNLFSWQLLHFCDCTLAGSRAPFFFPSFFSFFSLPSPYQRHLSFNHYFDSAVLISFYVE